MIADVDGTVHAIVAMEEFIDLGNEGGAGHVCSPCRSSRNLHAGHVSPLVTGWEKRACSYQKEQTLPWLELAVSWRVDIEGKAIVAIRLYCPPFFWRL